MVWLKRIVTIALLGFVGVSVGTLVAQEVGRRAAPVQAVQLIPLASDLASSDGPCRIIVCYFHNTERCATCLAIEDAARETVETAFADDLAAGRVTWLSLDMEQPENRPYIDQFDLAMPTLVVIRLAGLSIERWTALGETWGYIRSPVRFSMYVGDALRAVMEGCE
ncbi:MAG: nitrophenyl compound nitroreductase subunit ArsF family protein [Candidatus Bipolaricaulota bacterium]